MKLHKNKLCLVHRSYKYNYNLKSLKLRSSAKLVLFLLYHNLNNHFLDY